MRVGELVARAGRHFDSLQSRLLAVTVLIFLVVMAGVIVVVEARQRAAIIGEVLRRGEVITRDLAAVSSGPLLLYSFTALEQNVDRVRANADVVYAIVLDAEGRVAAHSRRPELVGRMLTTPVDARALQADALLVQETIRGARADGVYDFAVPVLVGAERWGTVRVGLSKRRMEAQITRTRLELGGLTVIALLVVGVAAALGARAIARPVRELSAGAAAIARGDLDYRIASSGFGEIGQLAVVFNHMSAQLLQQRRDLEATHEVLRDRFQEVADLKSYTDSILASITSGIVTLDLDGRVATFNPAAELLTGIFSGEIGGRYCTEVFAHTPEVAELLMETLASRSGTGTVSLSLRRRNGTSVPVEMSAAPLRGLEGKDLGVVGVFRDVSQVRELEGQLRRSDRLAALGTLAAGLAHEIKNPLASLRTFTRIMPRKFEDGRFRETFMRVVPRELERINGIVESLARAGAAEPAASGAAVRPDRPGPRARALRQRARRQGDHGDARIRARDPRDHRRRRAALRGLRQPRQQRPRRHGDGWPAHRAHGVAPPRRARPLGRAGTSRAHRHRRHGQRNLSLGGRESVRSLLHDQGRGHRAGPGPHPQDHRGPRRHHRVP